MRITISISASMRLADRACHRAPAAAGWALGVVVRGIKEGQVPVSKKKGQVRQPPQRPGDGAIELAAD